MIRIIFIILITIVSTKPSNKPWCLTEIPNSTAEILEELTHLVSNRSAVFFIETSCSSRQNGRITLNPRQACSIESTAFMNPNTDIYVLFPSIAKLQNVVETVSDRVIKKLLNYPNIYFRYINFTEMIRQSPLNASSNLIIQQMMYSKFTVLHASDIARLLVLWKFGGTYLDLDIVVKKPFKSLGLNFGVPESDDYMSNALFSVDRNGVGHLVVERWLQKLKDQYNPRHLAGNGPLIFNEVLKELCHMSSVKDFIMQKKQCQGFTVYPTDYFLPIHWSKWKLYMLKEYFEPGMKLTQHAISIHVWSTYSYTISMNVREETVYNYWAKQKCPTVFSVLDKEF